MMLDFIQHYNSGPKNELVYQIPLTTWHPYDRKVVYSIKLEDIKKGDILLCGVTSECTSEHHYNIQISGYIILGETQESIEGEIIVPPFGGNVTRNEHHRPFTCTGTHEVKNKKNKYVNFVMYAASTAANPNDFIVVENNYGRLYVIRFPNH